MLRITLILALAFGFCISRCRAALEVIEHTTSPDGKLALAIETSEEADQLRLVRLPDDPAILRPCPWTLTSSGRLHTAASVWNLPGQRIAVVQGGRVELITEVFDYAHGRLQELSLPNFGDLPGRWFRKAAYFRGSYVEALRWRGRTRLELSVRGTAAFNNGDADSDYFDYDFNVLVKFDKTGDGTIVRVAEEHGLMRRSNCLSCKSPLFSRSQVVLGEERSVRQHTPGALRCRYGR